MNQQTQPRRAFLTDITRAAALAASVTPSQAAGAFPGALAASHVYAERHRQWALSPSGQAVIATNDALNRINRTVASLRENQTSLTPNEILQLNALVEQLNGFKLGNEK